MPFVIAGIWYLCRRHRLQRPAYRVIPITLATYPVAALTIDPYHSTRCINGAIVWTLLIAMGAIAMWRRGRWMKAAVLALILGTTIETGLYMKDYWTEFRRRVTLWNDDALTQTLKEGISRLRPGEAIYISASCFFHKIRPISNRMRTRTYCFSVAWIRRAIKHTDFQITSVRTSAALQNQAYYCAVIPEFSRTIHSPPQTLHYTPNLEPVPQSATRLMTIPYIESKINFEIYRFSEAL